MSHFQLNPQINTAGDATAAREGNAPNPGNMINQARSLIGFAERQDGVQSEIHRSGWKAIQEKTRAPGDAGQMALATELLAFAQARKSESDARLAAANAAHLAREIQAKGALMAVANRASWAEANLKPLWALGDALKSISARIQETRRPVPSADTPSPTANLPWRAPVATTEELVATLSMLEADLASLSAAVAKARSGLKA